MKNSIEIYKRGIWTFLFALVVIVSSCSKTEDLAVAQDDQNLMLKSATACTPATYKLFGGQTIEMGNLTVWNNETTIYVTYNTSENYPMSEVQLWVGTDISLVPTANGAPIPGQFDLKYSSDEGFTQYTFEVPMADVPVICGGTIYIYAHASAGGETLWSEGTAFDSNRWGWYSEYTICCNPPTQEPTEVCTEYQNETAFGGSAKGLGKAWWYYYTGSSVQTLWAGQKIDAGTVEVSGGYVTITLAEGWELQPVDEPVKIQGYNTIPTSRPTPGLFTTYKGTSLTVPVESFTYYAIHLDVRRCTKWETVYN
ncbi:MAG TPA: hypothetical protein DHV48_15865 [Prolixibacteraceae bacterium]|nr:hypothetical protein [Prolixibacteraceae bacterium]